MNATELKSLSVGDLIRHKTGHKSFVVTGNFGDRVTAAMTADVTNPIEWDIVSRADRLPIDAMRLASPIDVLPPDGGNDAH